VTNARSLAEDYLRRARLRLEAISALIRVSDFADAVRESQEAAELAVKALLKLKGIAYPRAHDVARLLDDPAILGPLLSQDEVAHIQRASKQLRRDRELSFYGDEDVIPLDYYDADDADEAVAALRSVLDLAVKAFERNGTPLA
jgi:HEPN domain-containing protein